MMDGHFSEQFAYSTQVFCRDSIDLTNNSLSVLASQSASSASICKVPIARCIGEMGRTRLDERPDYVCVSVRTGQMESCVAVLILVVGVHPTRQDSLCIFDLTISDKQNATIWHVVQ